MAHNSLDTDSPAPSQSAEVKHGYITMVFYNRFTIALKMMHVFGIAVHDAVKQFLILLFIICMGCVQSTGGGGRMSVPSQAVRGEDVSITCQVWTSGYPKGNVQSRYQNEKCFIFTKENQTPLCIEVERKVIDDRTIEFSSVISADLIGNADEVYAYWTYTFDGHDNPHNAKANAKKISIIIEDSKSE